MTISDWPMDERPRERLLGAGAAALSNAELLAVLLRTGRRGQTAVELGRALLSEAGGLHELLDRPATTLVKRLGPAQACSLLAAAELGRRQLQNKLREGTTCNRPEDVGAYLRARLAHEVVEVFGALFLDTQLRLIAWVELARGSLSSTTVFPREVVRKALELHAAALVFAHNHPSGNRQPSHADTALTEQLVRALRGVDIRVVDHFIVGDGDPVSMAALGLL
jgi:DNA repair protein RadC